VSERRPTYRVLHQDDTLVVVDKAPGVLVVQHPGTSERCLLDDLRRDGLPVAPVHRLDKETSGVLVLCLDKAARKALETAFRKREVAKTYLALVAGVPASRSATIDVPILDTGKGAQVDPRGGRAVSRYEVLETYEGRASLVRVTMETGRHNQVRVHMAHIGHPLLGDAKFGRRRQQPGEGARRPRRALLHAESLALDHPQSGERLRVVCPPPADLMACREAWGGGEDPVPPPRPAPARSQPQGGRGERGKRGRRGPRRS
jgi:23S rRNA pseudouridine1911/1915/1917 synthase